MGRPAPAQAEPLSLTARSRVGGAGPDLVCSVSGSRSVRLGDVLSGASPDGLGSDPGPSGLGLEGSYSVRLVFASHGPALAPSPARSGLLAQSRVRHGLRQAPALSDSCSPSERYKRHWKTE
jgi:hypothetical protein